MSEFDKIGASALRGAEREAVSAVRLSEQLTAEVDAWAEAHGMVRSDAIRRLIELGLSASASLHRHGRGELDSVAIEALAIEALAVRQIDHLLDPRLAPEERERRIRRLTEGPPEFTDQRIDLPKPRK
jgi:hypothetical protein